MRPKAARLQLQLVTFSHTAAAIVRPKAARLQLQLFSPFCPKNRIEFIPKSPHVGTTTASQ